MFSIFSCVCTNTFMRELSEVVCVSRRVKNTQWAFKKKCDIIKEIFPSALGENSGTVCLY